MYVVQSPSPVVGQVVILAAVWAVFYLGVVVKGYLTMDPTMTWRQQAVIGGAGFFVLGVPLCEPVYLAYATAQDNIFTFLGAFAAPLTCGLAARSELQKRLGDRGM